MKIPFQPGNPAPDFFSDRSFPSAFRLNRLALAPIRSSASVETLESLMAALSSDEEAFVSFLIGDGLGSVWHQALESHGLHGGLSPPSMATLKAGRFAQAAQYLRQKAVLLKLDQIFQTHEVAYAAIKGCHVRELVYDDPALRPACDIDILVSPKQRVAAARALVGSGFRYCPHPDNISHEASLTKDGIDVDLHWNIFRPGRSRIDVTDSFIARRARVDGFFGLNDDDAVFLMLTHPAFFKYVCSPNMSLQRVADFVLWTRQRPVNWAGIAALLNETGLKTAAWTMLRWFVMLDLPVPESFMAQIQPGRLRRRYLNYWLEHNLPTKWFYRLPLLIQLGMTLFLHDHFADAVRAMRGWLRSYFRRHRDQLALLDAVEPKNGGCAARNPFRPDPDV